MKNKYFYRIYKLKIKPWIKYWLIKAGEIKGVLSEILTGTSFYLEDSIKRKFNIFNVKGNTTQESTTGVNLAYVEAEGKYRGYTNGNFFTNDSFNSYIAEVEESTEYTAVSLSGGVDFSNLCFFDKNMNFLSGDGFNQDSGGRTNTRKLTTVENCKYITIAVSNTITDFMVVKGTTIPTSYEPYTGGIASPNPSYEQPIKSAGDNGSITKNIVNKNLFDGWELGDINDSTGQNINGNFICRSKNYIKVKELTAFNFKALIINTSYNFVRVFEYDENKNFIKQTLIQKGLENNYLISNFTTTETTNFIKLKAIANNDINKVPQYTQLELGSTATDFVSHEEQTYTITTQQPMRSIGDVRDIFFKNTIDSEYYDENLTLNGWYERHYIIRKIFDGTENFVSYSTSVSGHYRYMLAVENIKKPSSTGELPDILSTHYKRQIMGTEGSWGAYQGISIDTGANNIVINDDTYYAQDTTDYKTWLATKYASGNPVYVYYVTTNPLDLPCTQAQIEILENKPYTYSEQTNISSTDTTPAYLEIQYWKEA